MGKNKNRKDMTPEELAHIRRLDRERKQRYRINLNKEKKDKIRVKDRQSKAEARKNKTEKEKDEERITSLIGMRKYRLMESEENRKIARNKAKEGMKILRKEGPIRKYVERARRHVWAVRWKKYLSQNPELKELEKKKKMKN